MNINSYQNVKNHHHQSINRRGFLSKNGKIKPITRMKKNTTRDTNGVLGEALEVGCTLKRSFMNCK